MWVQHTDESFPRGSEAWQYVARARARRGRAGGREVVLQRLRGHRARRRARRTRRRAPGRGGRPDRGCIRGTIHAAFTLGYDVTLVGDAHTTEDQTQWGMPAPSDIISLTNLYWAGEAAPGRTAAVVDTREVSFAG